MLESRGESNWGSGSATWDAVGPESSDAHGSEPTCPDRNRSGHPPGRRRRRVLLGVPGAAGRGSDAGGSAANDECADQTIAVTAIDHGYEGIDAELSAGVYGVDFSNEGDEFHEMIVLRKGDDTTESFEEIFEMDEEAAMALVQGIGATFAPPDAEESEGPPHFTQGMVTEFTVS